jgi:hypothetical protein
MDEKLQSVEGWVSIDFMVASLIILMTIPGLVAISSENINTANSVHRIATAKVLTDNVAETIEMVYSGGKGCSIIFRMPPNIDNKSYYLNVNSSGVYMMMDGLMGSSFISSMKISNTGSGVQLHADQTYNISNKVDGYGNTYIVIKTVIP